MLTHVPARAAHASLSVATIIAAVIALVATGCIVHRHRFVYAPAGANAWSDGFSSVVVQVPQHEPAGTVVIMSRGITAVSSADSSTVALHVRVVVTNSSDDVPWAVDTRTAMLDIPRVRKTGALFVTTDAATRRFATIARGQRRTFDFFFPMPSSIVDRSDLGGFDFQWTVTTERQTFAWTTQFRRVDVAPPPRITIGN